MKKEYEENKLNKDIENNSNGEFFTKEDSCAALCLASLAHVKLDKITAVALDKERRKHLRGIKSKDEQEEPNSVIHDVSNSTTSDDYQSPDIPPIAALADLIGECSRPYEKRLTETDLKDSQLRLSLSKDHVQKFLIPLLKEDEDVIGGIPVVTYDSEGNTFSMMFKFWSSKMYVLTGREWKTFYKQHKLEKDNHTVTVWMFRHELTHHLCFAITWRESPVTDPKPLNTRKRKQFSNATFTIYD